MILDEPFSTRHSGRLPGIAAASAVKCGPLWLRVSKRDAAEGQQYSWPGAMALASSLLLLHLHLHHRLLLRLLRLLRAHHRMAILANYSYPSAVSCENRG